MSYNLGLYIHMNS